jgi:hypothetical protein
LGRRELCAAIGAKSRSVRVIKMAGRALVGQASSPSLARLQINRGMGEKSTGLTGGF